MNEWAKHTYAVGWYGTSTNATVTHGDGVSEAFLATSGTLGTNVLGTTWTRYNGCYWPWYNDYITESDSAVLNTLPWANPDESGWSAATGDGDGPGPVDRGVNPGRVLLLRRPRVTLTCARQALQEGAFARRAIGRIAHHRRTSRQRLLGKTCRSALPLSGARSRVSRTRVDSSSDCGDHSYTSTTRSARLHATADRTYRSIGSNGSLVAITSSHERTGFLNSANCSFGASGRRWATKATLCPSQDIDPQAGQGPTRSANSAGYVAMRRPTSSANLVRWRASHRRIHRLMMV